MRILIGAFIAVVLSISFIVVAYTHCHDTAPCEEVIDYLVYAHGENDKKRYWDKPDRNTVDFYVNPDHSGMPSLLTDVKLAATKWDNISVGNNETIAFNLHFDDETTTLEPFNQDNKNVVGWKCLRTPNKNPLARTRKYVVAATGEIIEADIALNYYRSFKKHGTGTNSDGKTCVRDVALHEWGHFAGLEHVKYITTNTSGMGNCPHWSSYTMHMSHGPNTHDRENIECEDKYALEYIYGK